MQLGRAQQNVALFQCPLQQLRISNYASATTTQQPRLSNHGSATKLYSRFSNQTSATKYMHSLILHVYGSWFTNHGLRAMVYEA